LLPGEVFLSPLDFGHKDDANHFGRRRPFHDQRHPYYS
jgi:hypothetical protein